MPDLQTLDVGDEVAILQDRISALGRTSDRLSRLINELRQLEIEIDRLECTLTTSEINIELRQEVMAEIEINVESYNHIREAATSTCSHLIQLREGCGFRGHEMIHRCYRIPAQRLPSYVLQQRD